MIQEYLFIDSTERDEIEKYSPEKVTVKICGIENSDCWIATYSVQGEKEESANILSRVNTYIIDRYHPTVLANGCAAYYNKILFPYINEFERKLRKLLYLKSALSKGDKVAENIQNLENKDLGEIFSLLFTDEQFIKNVKLAVNGKTWQFTRKEILLAIERLSEDTTWDHLIGAASVPVLREQFVVIKDYRNDVMHAHDIDTKAFRDSKKLFESVNEQLESEIKKIIDIAEKHPEETKSSDYNSDLSSILEKADITASLPSTIENLSAIPAIQLSELYSKNLNIPSILQQQQLQNALSNLQTIKIDSPVWSQLHGLSSEITEVTNQLQGLKIDIPALTKYQEMVSKINIPAVTEAMKFQEQFQSIAGSSFEKSLQSSDKLSAKIVSTSPGIQTSIEKQPDDFLEHHKPFDE